jgi:hypothetical protein
MRKRVTTDEEAILLEARMKILDARNEGEKSKPSRQPVRDGPRVRFRAMRTQP